MAQGQLQGRSVTQEAVLQSHLLFKGGEGKIQEISEHLDDYYQKTADDMRAAMEKIDPEGEAREEVPLLRPLTGTLATSAFGMIPETIHQRLGSLSVAPPPIDTHKKTHSTTKWVVSNTTKEEEKDKFENELVPRQSGPRLEVVGRGTDPTTASVSGRTEQLESEEAVNVSVVEKDIQSERTMQKAHEGGEDQLTPLVSGNTILSRQATAKSDRRSRGSTPQGFYQHDPWSMAKSVHGSVRSSEGSRRTPTTAEQISVADSFDVHGWTPNGGSSIGELVPVDVDFSEEEGEAWWTWKKSLGTWHGGGWAGTRGKDSQTRSTWDSSDPDTPSQSEGGLRLSVPIGWKTHMEFQLPPTRTIKPAGILTGHEIASKSPKAYRDPLNSRFLGTSHSTFRGGQGRSATPDEAPEHGLGPLCWIQAGDWRLAHHRKAKPRHTAMRIKKRSGDTRVVDLEAKQDRLNLQIDRLEQVLYLIENTEDPAVQLGLFQERDSLQEKVEKGKAILSRGVGSEPEPRKTVEEMSDKELKAIIAHGGISLSEVGQDPSFNIKRLESPLGFTAKREVLVERAKEALERLGMKKKHAYAKLPRMDLETPAFMSGNRYKDDEGKRAMMAKTMPIPSKSGMMMVPEVRQEWLSTMKRPLRPPTSWHEVTSSNDPMLNQPSGKVHQIETPMPPVPPGMCDTPFTPMLRQGGSLPTTPEHGLQEGSLSIPSRLSSRGVPNSRGVDGSTAEEVNEDPSLRMRSKKEEEERQIAELQKLMREATSLQPVKEECFFPADASGVSRPVTEDGSAASTPAKPLSRVPTRLPQRVSSREGDARGSSPDLSLDVIAEQGAQVLQPKVPQTQSRGRPPKSRPASQMKVRHPTHHGHAIQPGHERKDHISMNLPTQRRSVTSMKFHNHHSPDSHRNTFGDSLLGQGDFNLAATIPTPATGSLFPPRRASPGPRTASVDHFGSRSIGPGRLPSWCASSKAVWRASGALG